MKMKNGSRGAAEPLKTETADGDGTKNGLATAPSQLILPERFLFKFDSRDLDAGDEMLTRRVYTNPPLRHPYVRLGTVSKIINRRSNWPELPDNVLSMEVDRDAHPILWFKFVHSHEYAEAQHTFWKFGLRSRDVLERLLAVFPSHLDTMLYLAERYRILNDDAKCCEMLERGIFTCERSFSPKFQVWNYDHRLSYEVFENRAFFLLLHGHMCTLIARHCFHTALSFGKLLFSLDPVGDPLGMMFFIDTLALRARQYQYLLLLYENMKKTHRLETLLNFAYSVALAQFLLSNPEDDGDEIKTAEADVYLAAAIRRFPTVLVQLLNEPGVPPDGELQNNKFMCALAHERESERVKLLTKIYVTFCNGVWRNAKVLRWLEGSVADVIETLDSSEPETTSWNRRRHPRFVPRNLKRLAYLVGESSSPAYLLSDPAPPLRSRSRYPGVDEDEYDTRSTTAVGELVRSLMAEAAE